MKGISKRLSALMKRLKLTPEQTQNIRFPCC